MSAVAAIQHLQNAPVEVTTAAVEAIGGLTYLGILMAVLGLAMHFLSRYSEYFRTNSRISPRAYLNLDPPGWISAVIGAVVTVILLPELGPVVGLSATLSGCFVAGYMGSSLAAKLPGIFAPQIGVGIR